MVLHQPSGGNAIGGVLLEELFSFVVGHRHSSTDVDHLSRISRDGQEIVRSGGKGLPSHCSGGRSGYGDILHHFEDGVIHSDDAGHHSCVTAVSYSHVRVTGVVGVTNVVDAVAQGHRHWCGHGGVKGEEHMGLVGVGDRCE